MDKNHREVRNPIFFGGVGGGDFSYQASTGSEEPDLAACLEIQRNCDRPGRGYNDVGKNGETGEIWESPGGPRYRLYYRAPCGANRVGLSDKAPR